MGIQGKRLLAIIGLLALTAGAGVALHYCNRPAPTHPTPHGDQRWRIGYYEGGGYADYAGGLRGMVNGLAELDWMEPVDLPLTENEADTRTLWRYLATEVDSCCIQFAPDGYWSAGWNAEQRAVNRSLAVDKLQRGEIDLIIAMGTWAGQDLATTEHHVPVLVFRCNDPLRAGIIDSVEDSGLDHVMAEVDPEYFLRQVRLFDEIVDFQRLGVAYEDSTEGRIYANVAELQQAAAEQGFALIECQIANGSQEEAAMAAATAACYRQLAPQVDAVWIGAGIGEQPRFMPQVLAPLLETGVPTWSSMGTEAVRRGVLASVSLPADYIALGRWYTSAVARVLNGVKPRDLDQVHATTVAISINMQTARRIGFELPPGLLEAADQTFEDIEGE